jgi:DNA helicase-2/ATP-dependent DNA helicase PcrA
MSFADGLNEEQRAAVVHEAGPLVVFAGAGSGKTRVITHRVAHLVAERKVAPWKILAVTFTNKAAAEMRERLTRLLPYGAKDLWVGTFHATCARLLRRYAEEVGIKKDFVIYDDSDQRAMVARVARDLGLDDRRFPPRMLAGVINRAKNDGSGPEDLPTSDSFERSAQQVYATYEERMKVAGALDFGDLIYRMVHAMQKDPSVRDAIRSRFEHVLVDEYQDTNHVQYMLVRLLCEEHRNLCVVGDDDQSIYRFRGADRRNILDFSRHFPDARVVKLEQNYRSTQRILRVAHAVVSRNIDREPKQLWTQNDEGNKVAVIGCTDERDEASTITQLIRMLLESGLARKEIALLYRIHAQSRVFEEALRYFNLPYRVVGGLRFYDRAEVKDLLAYLRIVQNPHDDVSLLRVINNPPRGIGKTAITRLLDAAARGGFSVWSALQGVEEDSAHAGAARTSLIRFRELIVALQKLAAVELPSIVAQNVLVETGYDKALETEDSAEADARRENLREVIGSMKELEREAEVPSLASYLELVTLQSDPNEKVNEDSLTLMTVHAAKGLEFKVVIVAGLEEELFPHRGYSPEDDPDDLEEERRLAYVAFTRAEQRLFLSYAASRRVYGELKMRVPSRFLREMPAGDLDMLSSEQGRPSRPVSRPSTQRPSMPGYAAPGYRSEPPRPRASQPPARSTKESYVDRSEGSDDGESSIRRGMRVRHAKFGIGEVYAVTPESPPRVTVRFPGWGEKTLLANYLEPA